MLALRSLSYYWRTHLAVILAVAVAVGVLTGALIVGDSMRGSLRALFLSRLGRAEHLVTKTGFFQASFADDVEDRLRRGGGFSNAEVVPILSLPGVVTREGTSRRAGSVELYGVDERFFGFHRSEVLSLGSRGAAISPALARELDADIGDSIVVRVEDTGAVSAGSLFGRRDVLGPSLRLQVESVGEESGFFPFSVSANQGEPRTIFVPISRLQRELGRLDAVNSLMVSGVPDSDSVRVAIVEASRLETLGVSVSRSSSGEIAVETETVMVNRSLELATRDVAGSLDAETVGVFAYLANAMRVGESEVPYSLVAGVGRSAYDALSDGSSDPNGIVLNDWAAQDLGAKPGDSLEMTFYLWRDEGRIVEQSGSFTVARIVSLEGEGWAADRALAPTYPGISDAANLADWDPPFPIDFGRIDDRDERYWDEYRSTPKAFIPLARAQQIWPVRQGELTAIRLFRATPSDSDALSVRSVVQALEATLSPLTQGFSVTPVRELGLNSSRGATDFGEYFIYFSYFLMVSGLLLTALFFKLAVEQRREQLGTLMALGFSLQAIRKTFMNEALLIAMAGSLLGLVVAVGYAYFVIYGLRTFWIDAVGTSLLRLHVTPSAILLGLGGGFVTAVLTTTLVVRRLRTQTPRELFTGTSDMTGIPARRSAEATPRRAFWLGLVSLFASGLMVVASARGGISSVAGFFGAGNFFLVGLLCLVWNWLRQRSGLKVSGSGLFGVGKLGFRNASYQPGRTLVAIALIAFAVFIIVSVDAFRKRGVINVDERDSGTGGYPLLAEASIPIQWDIEGSEGRQEVGLPAKEDPNGEFSVTSLRLRPGEDASCLNLYRPQNPRVVGVPVGFREQGRFRFSDVLDGTDSTNPWSLLDQEFDDGTVPVIGDANSMQYVLHLGVGDVFDLPREGSAPIRLRLVATLSDSFLQSELLISEEQFLDLFPTSDGFRLFLLEAEPSRRHAVSELLEDRLQDFGLDVDSTATRLATYHRVENTYLSTFQTLGGLGLMLGTFGLGAILLRNVLERRSELALLRAIGYSGRSFGVLVYAENLLILIAGLAIGSCSALIAIAPAISSRGGELHWESLVLLLVSVSGAGVLSSAMAIRAAVRMPLLQALRGER